ncbi:Uncharacterized protein APZ42_014034 [Daphnia magna]|uniref:Transposable element P transposase-like RNase H domain-containing protein n=1 Tax=Daphnia magna TaxID=35525 RepID=A0A162Q9Z7_9CRUS|nr:Uncharacterized protein APZ42_014034 [Daphnia magna]
MYCVCLTDSLQDYFNFSATDTSGSIDSFINSASSQDSWQDCFNISAADTSIDSFVNSASPHATLESIDTGDNMPSVVSPSTVKRSRVKIITSQKNCVKYKNSVRGGKAELQAKCGRSQSMRYDGGFIMQCLPLKLKSSTTYTYLNKNNILPLPIALAIRRKLSSSDCKFGFNHLALESILKEMENLIAVNHWVSLMWDEMSQKKDLTWHPTKLEWHGIGEFGDDIDAEKKDGINTNALKVMFQPKPTKLNKEWDTEVSNEFVLILTNRENVGLHMSFINLSSVFPSGSVALGWVVVNVNNR